MADLSEALYFRDALGRGAYDGSGFHESPLVLALFGLLPAAFYGAVFVLTDVVVAVAVRWAARDEEAGRAAVWWQMLSPYAVVSCLAQNASGSLGGAALVLAFASASRRSMVGTAVGLAVAAVLQVYPLYVAPALCMAVGGFRGALAFVLTAGCTVLLLAASFSVGESAEVVWREVYEFAVLAPELRPNLSLWWYVLIEIFTEMRPFYTFVMQASIAVWVVPLTLRLRHAPLPAAWTVLAITTLLRPYLTLADWLPVAATLPLIAPVVRRVPGCPTLAAILLALTLALPVMWEVWMYSGAGNPNFFFASTVILLLTLGIFIRRVIAAIRHTISDQADASSDQADASFDQADASFGKLKSD